jgi:hypothetical protein
MAEQLAGSHVATRQQKSAAPQQEEDEEELSLLGVSKCLQCDQSRQSFDGSSPNANAIESHCHIVPLEKHVTRASCHPVF